MKPFINILALFTLACFLFVGCSPKKVKAYDNYYLGETIKDDSIFKAQKKVTELDHNHLGKVYERAEYLPNKSSALLSFLTINDVLAKISLNFGEFDYRGHIADGAMGSFKNYCSFETKKYFLESLRKKYGKETDSIGFKPNKDGISYNYVYRWDFKTHEIKLTLIVEDWLSDKFTREHPELQDEPYDQSKHNKMWIEYTLKEDKIEELKQNVKKELSKSNDKL